jgi:hypothetical protein
MNAWNSVSTSLYISMEWCSVENRDDFYLHFFFRPSSSTFSSVPPSRLLCRHALWTCRNKPTFWRKILHSSSFLKIEAASTSETSVNLFQTARRNNPGDSHFHTRRHENRKSHLFTGLWSTWSVRHLICVTRCCTSSSANRRIPETTDNQFDVRTDNVTQRKLRFPQLPNLLGCAQAIRDVPEAARGHDRQTDSRSVKCISAPGLHSQSVMHRYFLHILWWLSRLSWVLGRYTMNRK